ncbi:M23 family metallopeptidase [Synechococcus sp. UW179A]|uniref:M23 family metallopeptidase n=1 Tax=Synechococcus sp. UW179A TaxID=2575510 RepID=UPI001FCBBE13|nr:M23 family metallopeptidase [Synechococcus sp. UW179A]
MQRNNLLMLAATAIGGITWALVALTPTISAQPLPPKQVPERTGVSNLALLSQSRPRRLPDSHRPFRKGETLRLVYPLAQPAQEVQPYGWRYSDRRQRWRMHVGHDLIAPAATPVLAMLSGRVQLAQSISGYGLTVLLDHGRGWQTVYAHLQSADVHAGQLVRAGDRIGRVGRSGSASTDHLHVELRRLEGRQAFALDLGPLLLSTSKRSEIDGPPANF